MPWRGLNARIDARRAAGACNRMACCPYSAKQGSRDRRIHADSQEWRNLSRCCHQVFRECLHAAKAMTGRRFLATAAPHLPLADCNFPECQCKFAHYDDRRTGRDRRSPFAAGGSTGATGTYERERREKTDRRNNDQYDW